MKFLTPGAKFYDVVNLSIKRYTYLCVHPDNSNYHILINTFTKDPFKIYEKDLKDILDKNLTSNEEAESYLVNELLECIDLINKRKYENSIIQ